MSAADDLIAAVDAGKFDTALDARLVSMGKDELMKMKADMESKSAGIPDQDKRHLYKNGIASIQMTADSM